MTNDPPEMNAGVRIDSDQALRDFLARDIRKKLDESVRRDPRLITGAGHSKIDSLAMAERKKLIQMLDNGQIGQVAEWIDATTKANLQLTAGLCAALTALEVVRAKSDLAMSQIRDVLGTVQR